MDRTEILPLTKAVLIPIRLASTIHAGHISVSRNTRTWGRSLDRALLTEKIVSMGAYRTGMSSPNVFLASSMP